MKTALFLSALFLFPLAASGLEERELQAQIDAAIRAGQGEIRIPAGRHRIAKGIFIKDARNLRVMGEPGAILELPPVAFAETATDAVPGAREISLRKAQNLAPRMRLNIEADGDPDSFTKKPKPFQLAVVESIQDHTLILAAPLKHPVPAGTLIRHADGPNVFEIRGASENLHFEGLTIDGGRREGDPPIRGHVQLCGFMVSGAYSYENGPSGPKPTGLVIKNCVIENCHGRGIAFYSVENSRIEDCQIRNNSDEAIDLDHFTVNVQVLRNQLSHSLVGIEMNDASQCRVEGNRVENCQLGINLWRWCKQPGLNEGNDVRGNTFLKIRGNTLQIGKGTARNVFIGNEIAESGRNGISLFGTAHVVKENRIRGSAMKDIAIMEEGALAP